MKILFGSLKKFFTAPVFAGDQEKTRSAKLLYQIITVIWVLPVLLLTIGTLSGRTEVFPPAVIISIGLLILMVLSRIGWVGLASTFITAMIILVFGYADFQNAGNIQPSTLITAVAIIMSGLLLGKRAPLVAAILIAVSHAVIVYLQLQGVIKLSSPPALGLENIIITSIMVLMIGSLFQFVISRLQSALDEARKNESELQISNRELAESRVSLEQRVAERTGALANVAEISAATSTILESDKLLQKVVDLSKERFNFYHAHIYLLDEARKNLVLASGAGEPGRQMVTEGRSISLDREQSLVARAARERKGVTVNDVTLEPDFLPNSLLPNTRSELAVPMIVGENVIGVFDVQSDVVGRFTDSDIAVQTTLASQVASAVQNSRLYAEAENSALEARSLVQNAPEAIIIVDLTTGLFADPNENAMKLYSLPQNELVKVGPAQMSPPKQPNGRDSTQAAMEKIGEAMQGGTPVFEWMHRNGQGQDIPCEVRLVRMPGDRPRVRASVTDITERKRIEELTRQRAQQQATLNLITQRIQSTTTVEAALKMTARELGHAVGLHSTLVELDPQTLADNNKSN